MGSLGILQLTPERPALPSIHGWVLALSLPWASVSAWGQVPCHSSPWFSSPRINEEPSTHPPRALALSSHIFQILFSWNPLVFLIELYRGQTDETRINEECPRRDRQEQRGPLSWRSCTLLEPLPLQRNTVSFPLPCIPS